jgi:hypothetical protein
VHTFTVHCLEHDSGVSVALDEPPDDLVGEQ